MYTVVLMAAMSAGEANPQWLFNHGCCNTCNACSCSCYAGNCGGGWFAHHGGWGCCGGYGNYNGTPFMGLCGGSHWDGAPGYGAYGCYSSYGCMGPGYCGGCYASAGYAPGWPGAYGGCYGYGGGWGGLNSFTCGGNYGCYGGYACYGMPTEGHVGDTVVPVAPGTPGVNIPSTTPAPAPMIAPPLPPKASLENKVRSRVIIDTPEAAKLYVDGQLMQTASTHRVFQTPELSPGSVYFYDLKIEMVQNGKTVSEEKRIYVRPGTEAQVAFNPPAVSPDIATVSAGRE